MISLESDEIIHIRVRKHWLVVAAQALSQVLIALLPLVLVDMVRNGVSTIPFVGAVENPAALGVFLYALWLLVLWMIFALDWTDYYLDVWYVTNRRLIDVEQKGMFHRNEAIVRLEDIQDVTVVVDGLLATLLGYGDIVVQSAAAEREFVIRHAAKPELVKQKILELQREVRAEPARVVVVH